MTVEEQSELNHTVYLHSLLRRIARQRMARARRQAEAQASQKDRQEGRQEGEEHTLLAIASRLMSPAEVERLSTLTLDALRELVERELAALTSSRSSNGAR